MLKVKEINALSKESDEFDDFWLSYPKKVNKKTTKELWKKNKLNLKAKEIMEFIDKAIKTDRWKSGYIKAPDVFIRGEHWEDDLSQYISFNSSKPEVYKPKYDPLNY